MVFKESRPIYLQIADRICDEIMNCTYLEDERIPSVRDYAARVEVNANTVFRSFDYLQQSAIIYNKRGLGFFVSSGARQQIIDLRKNIFLEEDIPEFYRKMQALNISLEDITVLLQQQKLKILVTFVAMLTFCV